MAAHKQAGPHKDLEDQAEITRRFVAVVCPRDCDCHLFSSRRSMTIVQHGSLVAQETMALSIKTSGHLRSQKRQICGLSPSHCETFRSYSFRAIVYLNK